MKLFSDNLKRNELKARGMLNESSSQEPMNWSLCCLCQQKTDSQLVVPSNSKRYNKGTGYSILEERLVRLKALDALPLGINDLTQLDDGYGIAATLERNKGKWHKKCYDKCGEDKIKHAQKRKSSNETNTIKDHSPVKKLLRCLTDSTNTKNMCFFCNKCESSSEPFHRVETLSLDQKIRNVATELNDSVILTKLAAGDMTATDSVYHKKCLTTYNNRYRSHLRRNRQPCTTTNEMLNHKATAFAELVSYIEKFEHIEGKESHIFKLSELNKMYTNRLKELGIDGSSNSSHLKEKILSAIPSLEEHKSSYETVLSFRNGVGDKLLLSNQNYEDETLKLMRVASIVRRDIFKHKYHFHGSFQDQQYNNFPESLLVLVNMILHGNDISNETENANTSSDIVNSLSQLIVFNTLKRKTKNASYHRHISERETMLPLYLGLLIHGKTRKRELIDILHERGLCISYGRVLQISTDIANSIITQFEESGVVCPKYFRDGVFTTGNLDNIDYNPSSNTSRDAFHGTAVSLTQHHTENTINLPVVLDIDISESSDVVPKRTKHLPEFYTDIPPVSFTDTLPLPRQRVPLKHSKVDNIDTVQSDWLKHVHGVVESGNIDKDDYISWSGYFAARNEIEPRVPATSALLPLFRDEAHNLTMIRHGMNIIRDAVSYKNPGQVPVLTVDQPLYVIAKKIQWTWPGEFGEDRYVVLMGGLHVEMSFLKLLGDWLEGSGWLSALTSANIITPGRAEVVQRGANTSRGQWIHQVLVASLYILQQRAYKAYAATVADGTNILSFPEWCDQSENSHPQFMYWNKTMKLELLFLQFLKSEREANFSLYKHILEKMLPWMFALDHVHYARWLSIHLQDLENLEMDCPDVYKEFNEGKFVTQKSRRTFSCIAHDQVHEQLNALIKGDGGFVGITESPETLNRWTVSSPEIARILSEVEVRKSNPSQTHHEQNRSSQSSFLLHTQSLVAAIDELGNPFTEDSLDLIALDSKVVLSCEAIESVRKAEEIGNEQYSTFVREHLNGDGTIYDPIKKNNLILFKSGGKGALSKSAGRIRSMKADVQLFSRMYISCQNRDGDIDAFFEHENHPWPPSLAEQNSPRSGNKSDLVTCLEKDLEKKLDCPDVDVIILDGAAIVQRLDPKKARTTVQTFGEYAQEIFLPFVLKHLQKVSQIDVVWDTYQPSSLKAHARRMRGSGDKIRFSDKTKLPTNWKSFLRNDDNKTQLFHLLAESIKDMDMSEGKRVLTTFNDKVLCSKEVNEADIDLSGLQPCNHEEADTRMALHAANAFRQGKRDVLIYATDTDVLVIAVALSSFFSGCTLWLGFGHSNSFRYIPAHSIAEQLGSDASWALLFLHAFSGCDTVSFFNGIGKKTAYRMWLSQTEMLPVFKRLSSPVVSLTNQDTSVLERFVVLLYSKTAVYHSVNEARKHLFSQKSRQIENLPPSKCALIQHIKRAIYQAAHVWGQMHVTWQVLPSPSDWVWTSEDSVWVPKWTTLPEASKHCRELIKCNCKTACAGRCKCFKANLPCTYLCFCQAGCDRE